MDIYSGGDATLDGAIVAGNRVTADIREDLLIGSQQDTSTYTSQQSSSGASLSVSPTGVPTGGSLSSGRSNLDGSYRSVGETSGIKAGDAGFDVNVQGLTTLNGGVITSTDTAVNEGRNGFAPQGGVTVTDLTNTASFSGSGYSVTLSGGTGPDGKGGEIFSPGGSAGVASTSGNAASVTRGGVSGFVGDTSVRTGDAPTGIAPIFDAAQQQRELDAQVQITAAFGQQASSEWGAYANQRFIDALTSGDEAAQACWATDGACRAGGHAVIGALGGGAAGAAGAATSSLTAPAFNTLLTELGVPGAMATGLTEAYAAGMGAVAGGAAGAAGGFNEASNNTALASAMILATVEAGGPTLVRACLSSATCIAAVGTAGVAVLNGIIEAANGNGGKNPTLGDVNPNVFNGSESALPADTYGMPPNGASPPPEGEDKNPSRDSARNSSGEMLGRNGPRISSQTILNRETFRIDIENPNPGQRAGQLHIQTDGEKYIYNVNTNALENVSGDPVPRSVQRLLQDPQVQRAINRGLQYLGERPVKF